MRVICKYAFYILPVLFFLSINAGCRQKETKDDSEERIRVLYGTGCTCIELNKNYMALVFFQEATDMASRLHDDCDDSLLMDIHSKKALIHHKLGDLESEKTALEDAIHCATKINDTASLLHFEKRICAVYYLQEDFHNCLNMAEDLFKKSVNNGNWEDAALFCAYCIQSCLDASDGEHCQVYVDFFDEIPFKRQMSDTTLAFLQDARGRFYLRTNQNILAEQCFRDILRLKIPDEFAMLAKQALLHIFTSSMQQDSIVKYSSLISHSSNALYAQRVDNVLFTGDYHDFIEYRKIARNKTKNLKPYVIGAILLFFLFLAGAVLSNKGRCIFLFPHLKKQNKENRLSRLEKSKEVAYLKTVLGNAKNNSLTESEWLHLYEKAEMVFPGIFHNLRIKFKLSEVQYRICLLVISGFRASEINVLVCHERGYSTMVRKRLHMKIFGEEGGAEEFDKKLRELFHDDII